jgi:hypothetical protein
VALSLRAARAKKFLASSSSERPLKNDAFQLFCPDVRMLVLIERLISLSARLDDTGVVPPPTSSLRYCG